MNLFTKKQQITNAARQVVTDTSGLIDGRIVAIARAGFVPQRIIVPRFVVAELQFLADNGDSHKRERARFGLDVVRELQDLRAAHVVIAREDFADIAEVDDKLIALAKQYGAMLYTTDYNLNKVARIEGVMVLNVNELAHALRPPLLPGERIEIKLTQVGQDKTQGVGHLEDGTMVVVEKAARKIGQRVVVECSRMIQTQAGKMVFAVLASGPAETHLKRSEHQNQKSALTGPQAAVPEATRQTQQVRPKSKPVARETSKDERLPRRSTGEQRTNNKGQDRSGAGGGRNKLAPRSPRQSSTRRMTPEDRLMRALGS